jgi:ankyrin repeat protein
VRTVNALIERGAWLNASDACGQKPLHLAAAEGHANVVKTLLNHGAQINAVDSIGQTALHLAAKNDSTDVVKVLIQKGANAGIVDELGRLPWHLAVAHVHRVPMGCMFPGDASTAGASKPAANRVGEVIFKRSDKGNLPGR